MRKIAFKELKSADHRVLRDINEVLVLNIIRERQPISRIAIAEMAGLEPGTITRIFQRFLRSGLISEVGSGPSTPAGGRKPKYVTLNPARQCAIGMDIGCHVTSLALCDFNGQIQDFRRIQNTRDPEETLSAAADELLALLERARAYQEFGGIGVGLIGLIDREEGVILEGENLGWPEPVEVGKILRSKVAGVPFFFENNARLAAMGEIWFGNARLSEIRNLVFLAVGEGIGTGIIIDGQLYRGHHNKAGEFGHICIDPKGPRCSCGSHGCLEVLASDVATVQRYLKKTGAHNGSHADMKLITDLAANGDAYAVAALRETAHYLGWGLAPILYALGPEVVVIGGDIVQAWPLVRDEIWNACAERVSQPFLNDTTLVPSKMQVSAGLMGAVSLVLVQNFAVPEIFTAR